MKKTLLSCYHRCRAWPQLPFALVAAPLLLLLVAAALPPLRAFLPLISTVLAVAALLALFFYARRAAASAAPIPTSSDGDLQADILRLMSELEALADGDLSVRATVTESATGVIADIINYAIEELAVLVRRIHEASALVSAATNSSQHSCTALLESTRHQSEQVSAAVNTIGKTAQDIRAAAQVSAQAAEAAQSAAAAARNGEQVVRDTIHNMGEIRHHIQETSKRLKRLGESSQEISEVVALIAGITEQTNVLALNAGIQVAASHDSEQGLALVAEDIHQLAERANNASARIARIAQSAQNDARHAISSMEAATSQVVQGVKLADSAGDSLHEIGNRSHKSAGLIDNLRSQIQTRSDEVVAIASKMTATLALIDKTAGKTRKTAESVSHVARLSKELNSSVIHFRV